VSLTNRLFKGLAILTNSSGRVLGGSSAINYLVLMRASAPEYDAWYKFGGDHWNWKGLLPYFKKIQNYVAPTWGFDAVFPGITKAEDDDARRREPDFEGYAGPIQHTFNELYTDALKPFILTLNELGIKTNRTPVRSLASISKNCLSQFIAGLRRFHRYFQHQHCC
jgi:choline dehydrogenase-like flavoprotein